MKTFATSLALVLGLAASLRADDAIQIKLQYQAKVGDRITHHETEKSSMKMVITLGEEPVQDVDEKKDKAVAYTTETVKLEGNHITEGKYAIGEATHLVDGESEDFDLSGKTLVARKEKDGWKYFHEDGSAMSEEESAEAAEVLSNKDDKKDDQKDIDEVLSPKQPVKVGDSWDVDATEFAGMFSDGDDGSFDLEKSKGTLKLVSAEKKDGVQCGRVEGTIELVALKLGALVLDKPLKFKFDIAFDGCLDGSQPSGKVTMKGALKGKRSADAKGQKVQLDIDMAMEMAMTQEKAK